MRRRRAPLPAAVRTLVVLATVAIGFDALVALAAVIDWHSFATSPTTEYTAPEDDPGYEVASLLFAATSVLRYLSLVGLVVTLARPRRRRSEAVATPGVGRTALIVAGLVATEAVYLVMTRDDAHPGGAWCLWRVGTAVTSAVIAMVPLAAVWRSTRLIELPHGP